MDFSNCEELEGLINRLGVSQRLRSCSDPVSEHLDGSPTENVGRFMELNTPHRAWRNSMMETRQLGKLASSDKKEFDKGISPRVIDYTVRGLSDGLKVGSPPRSRKNKKAMDSGLIYNKEDEDDEDIEKKKAKLELLKAKMREERAQELTENEAERIKETSQETVKSDTGDRSNNGSGRSRIARPSLDDSVFVKEEVMPPTRERNSSSLSREMDQVPTRKKLQIKIGGRNRCDSSGMIPGGDACPSGSPADVTTAEGSPGMGIAGMKGLVTPRTTGAASIPSLELNVFVPKAGKGWSKMKVKVFESCTTLQVIGVVLRQHKAEGRRPRLVDDVRCFTLKMSEDDGTPDDDLPSLGHDQKVKDFGEDTFSLCRLEGVAPQAGADAMGPAIDMISGGEGGPAEGAGRTSRLTNGHMLLRVRLPVDPKTREEGQVTLEVTPDMTLRSVLEQIGRKRMLIPNHYCFKMIEHADQPGTASLDMGRIVGSLNTEELALREKVFADQPLNPVKKAKTSSSSVGDDELSDTFRFNFTEFTASQYKEYEVVKINRHGSRQDRIMGIDHECIYNTPPIRAQSFLGFKPATKKPSRKIRDVVFVATIEPHPSLLVISPREQRGRFRLVYEDQDGEKAQYDFETKTQHEAAEIVCRIEFLASILRRSESVDCQPILSSTMQGLGGNLDSKVTSRALISDRPLDEMVGGKVMSKAAWTKGVGAATKAIMKKSLQLAQGGSPSHAARDRMTSSATTLPPASNQNQY